jgi:hypothetical protein
VSTISVKSLLSGGLTSSAAGANTEVQFNNSGSFGADSNFTWTTGTATLSTGNLNLSGTGRRITADFSNGTASNRAIFQTSTTNGITSIDIAPNGTGNESAVTVNLSSDINNTAAGAFVVGPSVIRLISGIRGTGSYLPLTLWNGGSERMRITSDGEVYIAGTTDQGAYNLQVNGTGVWGAGAYVNGSDERMKENIQTIKYGLKVVNSIRPVTYQYKSQFCNDTSIQPGFIAQELRQALSGKDYVDGIVKMGPKYLSVAYQNLIPILTTAIQELSAKVDTLQSELNQLKGTE